MIATKTELVTRNDRIFFHTMKKQQMIPTYIPHIKLKQVKYIITYFGGQRDGTFQSILQLSELYTSGRHRKVLCFVLAILQANKK